MMVKLGCIPLRVGRKRKEKGDMDPAKPAGFQAKLGTLQVSLLHPRKTLEDDELKSTTFSVSVPFNVEKDSKLNVKVISHESPVAELTEVAYDGEDEPEDNLLKRNSSDSDLRGRGTCSQEFCSGNDLGFSPASEKSQKEQSEKVAADDAAEGVSDGINGGHLSDPGAGRREFCASSKLKRSCSNLETRDVLRNAAHQLPPAKSRSFEELQELSEKVRELVDPGSPCSAMTHRSADGVLLKKHSSSQILPSRSKRFWWKLFLWSHRNGIRPKSTKREPPPDSIASNKQGGYCSDTLDPKGKMSKLSSPRSFTEESLIGGQIKNNRDDQNWDDFHTRVSGLWPQNQWVAFSTESSLSRVNEWVKNLQINSNTSTYEDDDCHDGGVDFPPSPPFERVTEGNAAHLARYPDINPSEDALYANSVIQSLNSSSTVAHISSIGLTIIPLISKFSSLRSVNLSGNSIAHITPGSLPKGLHSLNLSRNKISAIEGLRELTRLRVLDLSYNRISRIGRGLSNSTMIKELYLAGNKISDVEGMHRLLKLIVLDLSFNKITTTKPLGQLVANYNSLQALNLLGNPIQNNISEEQLRKTVCSLLPRLVYLNKQPVKAREVVTDGVAKAALGNSSRSFHRRTTKKVNQSRSFHSSGHRTTASTNVSQRAKQKPKGQTQRHSLLKASLSAVASSSRQQHM